MQIIELKTINDFAPAYNLLKQTNTTLTKTEFNKRLKKMLAQGYRCIAAVDGGNILEFAGFGVEHGSGVVILSI